MNGWGGCLAVLAAATLGFAAVPADAVVINDRALATGPDAIDPSGGMDATGTVPGAALKTELTALEGFGVIQDFTGFTATTAGSTPTAPSITVSYLTFTDPLRPDIRLTTQVGTNPSGGVTSDRVTSGITPASATGNAQFLGNSGGATNLTISQTIEFGTYNAADGTFAADRAVSAIGFMAMRVRRGQGGSRDWTATFHDADDTVLSTQSINVDDAEHACLFGHISGSADIRRVVFTVTSPVNASNNANHYFDDLGFTTIAPEPA